MSGALVALSTGILGCIRRLPSTVWFYFDAQNGTNPFFPGTPEGNSLKDTILPWLRRIEQLNTRDFVWAFHGRRRHDCSDPSWRHE